ncbi:DUF3575 domain-containing protein [Algoriphagus aestuarii]|nr:DUF3575 domain-containing protein [Algoriphagus aestuarii]
MEKPYWLRIALILVIGILPLKTFSQQLPELDKKLLIKTSPLALFEPETIVIQGGIEYFFSPKFSIQSEIGVNGGIFGVNSSRGKNEEFKLWRTKNEFKFYSKKNYWGLELFFVNKDFIRTEDFFIPNKSEIFYDKAQVDFQVIGTGIKFGRQEFVSKNILLDTYVGLGLRSRFRQVDVQELSANQGRDEFFEYFLSSDRYRFNGWDYIPHFTAGIKIGLLTKYR